MGQSLCCPNDQDGIGQQSNSSIKVERLIEPDDLPYKCYEIVKEHGPELLQYSLDLLNDKLHSGIPLENTAKQIDAMFWLDKDKKKNCFKLFARRLKVSEGDDSRKWSWKRFEERKDITPELAVMEEVENLLVRGEFNVDWLNPNTNYKVLFVLSFRNGKPASGWDTDPVRSVLIPPAPDSQPQERTLKLTEEVGWGNQIGLQAGIFMNQQDARGNVQFYLESKGTHKKTGLVIKAVQIVPL